MSSASLIETHQHPLTPGKDRRRALRIPFEQKVLCKKDMEQNFGGVMKNLSETGALLQCSEPCALHTQVMVYIGFGIGKKMKLFRVAGRVVREAVRHGSPVHGYGVQFDDDTSEETKAALHDFINFKTTGVIPKIQMPTKSVVVRREPTNPKARLLRERAATSGKAMSFRKKAIAWIVVLSALILGITIAASRRHSLASMYSKNIPMVHARIDDEIFRGQVSQEWIRTTPKHAKEKDVAGLAIALKERHIRQAILTDSTGQKVAVIMRNLITPNEPGIRVFK